MKKLFVLFALIMSFALLGCNNATTEENAYMSDIEALESKIEAIEQQIEDLQSLIDNITVVEGLNGRVEYYINQLNLLELSLEQLSTEKDYLDKTKLPEYLFDLEGEFIDESMLANLLMAKYFDSYVYDEIDVALGYRYQLAFEITSQVDVDDLFARSIMLINELRNYSFYIIGSSVVELYFMTPQGNIVMTFLIQTLLTETIPINPEILVNKWLFTDYYGMVTPTLEGVQTYYDSYELNETFIGYVLDYK